MTSEQFKQLSQQLAGIELPPEANWWPLIWSITGLVITITIICLMIWKHSLTRSSNSLADQAPQRLKQIQQQWQSGQLDQRRAAYQLATLLRLGLGLKQLTKDTPKHLTEYQLEWQTTIERLQMLRYQANSQARLDEKTFITIQDWLKQGDSSC